ncbi:hypothetical protein Cgig2_022988 [Carnegiea gigantea]|uniref:Uncharacterized protein n=1 Tax=Carnegiea gigantea TaxID=171969 RepID=A0A9Q1GM16_9CARY|nr:hypothetical protein Cgig2_022988 [Carnegiea gigantea]
MEETLVALRVFLLSSLSLISPVKPLAHLSSHTSRSSLQSRLSLVHRSFNVGDQNGLDQTPAVAPALRTTASSIDLRTPTTSVRLLFGEFGGILVRELGRQLSFGTGSCIYLSSATSTTVHSWTCSPANSASSSTAIGKSLKKKLAEIQLSTQDEGTQGDGTPLPQLSIQTQLNIWKKVVGRTKKGKIYGFGMEGSCASSTSPSTINQVPIEVLQKEKQSKEKLKKKEEAASG